VQFGIDKNNERIMFLNFKWVLNITMVTGSVEVYEEMKSIVLKSCF
jgi:hypothetical protein